MSGLVPKLRFKQDDGSDFPEWEEMRLGEVFTIKYGKDHKSLEEGLVPVIGTGGVMRHVNRSLHNGPSVLIGRKGTIDKPQFIEKPFWTVDTLFYTEIKKQNIPYFVYQFVKSINWLKYNEATGVPSLSASAINSIRTRIPSLPEQQKIADFLSSVDAKIDAVKRKLDAFERYKKGLMQQIFSQKLRFKQDDGTDFPEWEEKRLGLLGKFTGGGTPDTNNTFYWNGHIPWISSSDILEGNINEPRVTRFINEEALRDSATKIVPAGSILIVTRVGVGKLAVSTHDICTSQDFTSFTPSRDNVFFLGFWMLINKNALLKLCQGTSIKGLTSDDLKSLIVPIPSLSEQQKIADFLSSVDAKIGAIKAQIEKLEAFKQGLLQQMLV